MERAGEEDEATVDERLSRSDAERQYSMRCFTRNARARAVLQQQAEQKDRGWSCWSSDAASAPSAPTDRASESQVVEPASTVPSSAEPDAGLVSVQEVFQKLRDETRLDETVLVQNALTAAAQNAETIVEAAVEAVVEAAAQSAEAAVDTAETAVVAYVPSDAQPSDVQLLPKTLVTGVKEASAESAPAQMGWMQSLASSWREVNSGRSNAVFLLVLCVAIFFCGLALGMQLA
jgi:isopentenyldiphosphate isomerase